MTAPNILLIVLDALREDGLGADLARPDRTLQAANCTATAPWIGPSRRPARLWDSPVTAGRSMQWNSPKAAVWCY